MTRKQAKKLGLKRYIGAQCVKHPERRGERRTASGNCLKCKQAAIRTWNKAHPDVHRRKVHRYRTVHREDYIEGALTRNAVCQRRPRMTRIGVEELTTL